MRNVSLMAVGAVLVVIVQLSACHCAEESRVVRAPVADNDGTVTPGAAVIVESDGEKEVAEISAWRSLGSIPNGETIYYMQTVVDPVSGCHIVVVSSAGTQPTIAPCVTTETGAHEVHVVPQPAPPQQLDIEVHHKWVHETRSPASNGRSSPVVHENTVIME